MSTVERLDIIYRAAERRVDELKQAVRYGELCASHLADEELLLAVVTASIAVLRATLAQAETDRNDAAEAVRIAWEARQVNGFRERLEDKAT